MNDPQARPSVFSPLRSRYLIFTLAAAALVALLALPKLNVSAQDVTATAETTETSVSTAGIVVAANTFLNSLDATQKALVMFDFNDTAQRTNWSNFPTGAYNRAGLSYSSMTDAQRTNVMALLKVALSDEGYQKVINIMTADEVLLQSGEGAQVGGATFGFGQYYVSFLGTPSETDPWILQWGGHHLGLNITFSGSSEVLTPSHVGCQPCTYMVNDQDVSVLGDEYTNSHGHTSIADIQHWLQATHPNHELQDPTIYRILQWLKGLELVAQTDVGTAGIIYELLGNAYHHHLICLNCGVTTHLDDHYLAPLRQVLSNELGFRARIDIWRSMDFVRYA